MVSECVEGLAGVVNMIGDGGDISVFSLGHKANNLA